MSRKAEVNMFNLAESGYPVLIIDRQALPFAGVDVGDVFKMIATVKLLSTHEQGNTYNFQVQQVGFPAKEPDLSTVRGRVESRRQKGGF